MNVLLRLGLLACPRAFREEHRDRIAADSGHDGGWTHPAAGWDLVAAGLAMRGEHVVRDVILGLRALARAPLFATVSIGAIALAVGVNVAVASVLLGAVLQPLPYPHANRLVFVSTGTSVFARMSALDARAMSERTRSFRALSLARETSDVYAAGGAPRSLNGWLVSGNYFSVLGTRPLVGRLLEPGDVGKPRIVLSASAWRQLFGGRGTAIGNWMRLGESSYQIVGVASDGFEDPAPYGLVRSAYWLSVDPHSPMMKSPVWRAFITVGELVDGVAPAAAQADASRVIRQLAQSDPASFVQIRGATVTPLFDAIVGPAVPLIGLLFATVGVVLLIACVNVANLALVRAARRGAEIAMRRALGATRGRILAQHVTEAALLSVAGGALGLGIGALLLAAFSASASRQVPRWEGVSISGPVVLYTLALLVVCTVCIGIVPALLRHGDGPSTSRTAGGADGRGARRLRSALVIAEIALAIAVVATAGLLGRSYLSLVHVPVGFDARNAYLVDVTVPARVYSRPDGLTQFLERGAIELAAVPGVTAASPAGLVPFSFSDYFVQTFTLPGKAQQFTTNKHPIGPDYFRVLGVALLHGRTFDARDRATGRPVAIVSASFARRYFGTLDAIGRRIVFQSFTGAPSQPSTIVGVSADVRNSFSLPPDAEAFVPATQVATFSRFIVRTSGPNAGISTALTKALRLLDPNVPAVSAVPFDDLLANGASAARAASLLFGVLAVIALLLAMAGIYGVTSYAVEQRTHEFGVRKAIGAGGRDIVGNVLASALLQSATGIAIGLAVLALFARAVADLLFQTSPFDPVTLAAVVLGLTTCTIVAAFVPALRAARIDPAAAVRYE
jgi:putative ABC transport system permease protein